MVAKFIWQLFASFHSALCHKRHANLCDNSFRTKKKARNSLKAMPMHSNSIWLGCRTSKKTTKQKPKMSFYLYIASHSNTHTHTRLLRVFHCCVTETKRLYQTCRISHWNFKPILIVILPHKRLSIDTKITNCWRRFRLWSNATENNQQQMNKTISEMQCGGDRATHSLVSVAIRL